MKSCRRPKRRLQASRDAFGTNTGLAELRERLLAAKRKTEADQAAQDALARARQLAEADDYPAAIAVLENFQPRTARSTPDSKRCGVRRKRPGAGATCERRINDAIARAEFEPSHRAAIAGLQEVLALDPDNATLRTAIKRRRSALRGVRRARRRGLRAALAVH